MAALVVLGVASFLARPAVVSVSPERVKGTDTGLLVSLAAYVMEPGGGLAAYDRDFVQPGMTLVFKTTMAEGGVVALAVKEGDGAPTLRFVGSGTRAGAEQLLERGGRTYGYRLEGGGVPRRFCAVAAGTAAELEELLGDLAMVFPQLDPASCVDVEGP
jgi:hypothetical protein